MKMVKYRLRIFDEVFNTYSKRSDTCNILCKPANIKQITKVDRNTKYAINYFKMSYNQNC